jgi:hypothetical protein
MSLHSGKHKSYSWFLLRVVVRDQLEIIERENPNWFTVHSRCILIQVRIVHVLPKYIRTTAPLMK